HGVLLLFGPPHHPQFYGQLERGNRDVRDAARASRLPDELLLDEWAEATRRALNEHWPRRSLGYKTPAEVWKARPQVTEDRSALRAEVADRSERIRFHLKGSGGPANLSERLAIEQALLHRGWLRREAG